MVTHFTTDMDLHGGKAVFAAAPGSYDTIRPALSSAYPCRGERSAMFDHLLRALDQIEPIACRSNAKVSGDPD